MKLIYSFNNYLFSATCLLGSAPGDGETLLNKANTINVLIKRENFRVLRVLKKQHETKAPNKTGWYDTGVSW